MLPIIIALLVIFMFVHNYMHVEQGLLCDIILSIIFFIIALVVFLPICSIVSFIFTNQ